MKKRITLLLAMIASISVIEVKGQTPATTPATAPASTDNWGIKFTGFVRNDVMFDSRQMNSAREGDLSLYPKDTLLDSDGKDINAAPTIHMLAITSRLTGTITGPDAFGAKTSGILEAEFFGNFDGGINEFRLRHAWAKLDWTNTQLAFGQYWHPLFVTDCYPGTINFNTGMPFQPFNRSPQVRLTQKVGKLNIIVAAVSQRDFASVAPSGYAATDPARNSAIPNAHLQLQYKSTKLIVGGAVDYTAIRPRLSSGAPVKVSKELATGLSFEGYVRVNLKPVTIKAEVVMGENLTHHVMIGGYLAYVNDTVSKLETYESTKTSSYWIDIAGTGKKVVPGIFVGYTKNDGASLNAKTAYGRGIAVGGRALDFVYRISPRVEFISGKFKMALEIEYTAAQYGHVTTDAKVFDQKETVANTRALFTTTLSF
jgi:hypothetical protein